MGRVVLCLDCWALTEANATTEHIYRTAGLPIPCARCGSSLTEDRDASKRVVECDCGYRGQALTGDPCPGCDEILVRLSPTDMFEGAKRPG